MSRSIRDRPSTSPTASSAAIGMPTCRGSWTVSGPKPKPRRTRSYPADWLEAQRHAILRRVEHLGHAARVITFPGRLVTQQMAKGVRLRVSPWAATAAAACLVRGRRRSACSTTRATTRRNLRSCAPCRRRRLAAGHRGLRRAAGRNRYRRLPLGAGAGARRSADSGADVARRPDARTSAKSCSMPDRGQILIFDAARIWSKIKI